MERITRMALCAFWLISVMTVLTISCNDEVQDRDVDFQSTFEQTAHSNSSDARWSTQFNQPPGVSGRVWAIATSGSNVYIGGEFDYAGGVRVNNIAKWDGEFWSSLGLGMDRQVRALVIDSHGNLYAGGDFHRAGNVTVNHIAKWDGSSWSALDEGMNNDVICLMMDDQDHLIAGGHFERVGNLHSHFIARWDGTTWSGFGSGMDNQVWALVKDKIGYFYAGEQFTQAGEKGSFGIAKRLPKWIDEAPENGYQVRF